MTFDDEITAALRRDLLASHVGFDAAGAEDMIRVATQSAPLGERRAYAAPLAAAAAVVVIGGGVATFAATHGDSTATGGGPVAPVPCPSTSASASDSTTDSASAIPPVYSATAYPTPVTTVPPLPTVVPSTTLPVYLPIPAPSTPPSTPPSTLPASTSTAQPTPVPSTSPTDDPCATSATPSASAADLPTARPATPHGYGPTAVTDCTPDMIDPGFSGCITFVVRTDAGPGGSKSFPVPNDSSIPMHVDYVLSGYQIDSSAVGTGTIALRVDGHTVATSNFAPNSNSVGAFDVAHPITVSRANPASLDLTCRSVHESCAATVRFAAAPAAALPTTPSSTPVPSATHS